MCGRYYIPPQAVDSIIKDLPEDEQEKIRALVSQFVREMNERIYKRDRFNVRPTQQYLVLTPDKPLEMHWGFMRSFSGAASKSIINATREKLVGKFWGKSFKERRGLILTGGFYEWKKEPGAKKGVPFAVELPKGKPMALACVWEQDKELGPCFSIVTAPASKSMQGLHERMPVIVEPRHWSMWIAGKVSDALELAVPYEAALHIFHCETPSDKVQPKAKGEQELF